VSSIRVSIGNASEISTRAARATAKEYLAQISRGQHPRPQQNGLSGSSENAENKAASADVTLKRAWQRYLEAHLVRKNRSEKTIAGYRDHVERIFAEWLDITLRELGADPARVAKKHDDVTKENGPYIANGAMRTLRAIYNHHGRRAKSFRQTILQTLLIGTTRSVATPGWARVTLRDGSRSWRCSRTLCVVNFIYSCCCLVRGRLLCRRSSLIT
jgi:hypothetical protein